MARVVPNFGNLKSGGVGASGYTPNVETEYGMIGKVAFQLIKEVTAKNPLAVFDFMPVDKGDTIEEAVVKLIESSAYDPTGAGALAPDTSVKMAVRYFNGWQSKKFKTTVSSRDLRKVLTEATGLEDATSKLVGTLSQSDIYDKFLDVKALLDYAKTAGSASDGVNTAFMHNNAWDIAVANNDYSPVIKQIKDFADAFNFVSSSYNRAGILRRNDKSDIRIIMPYKLKNSIDVDTLTGYFNLNKGEIEQMIIPIDTNDGYVYIVDKEAIKVSTRLYEMWDEKNADGAFWNYYLHVERLYAVVELFNAIYFQVTLAE